MFVLVTETGTVVGPFDTELTAQSHMLRRWNGVKCAVVALVHPGTVARLARGACACGNTLPCYDCSSPNPFFEAALGDRGGQSPAVPAHPTMPALLRQ